MRDSWCRNCNKATDQEQPLMVLEKLLPSQYSHTVCSYETIGDDSFKAAIKLKLSSEKEAKRWLEDFQSSSGFIWRTSKTYPNVGRYNKYRVDYRCRTIKKNSSCPATLFLILKRHPEVGERKSRSGDPHMKEGLFLHINLRNEHNHQESSAGALIRRDVSGETIEKLKQLFESGHTPSSALKALKSDLQVEDKDGEVLDRSVCPDLQFCYRLYYKLFKKAYNGAAGEEMFKELEQVLDDYNQEQGDVCAAMGKTPDNQLVIAVCTPLMKRVHAGLRESGEMVFVDSSGNCGRFNHHLVLLLTYSSAGGLPLGVFITTSETQETISAAMQLLLALFPPNRFFGHPDGPLVLMTADCTVLREALREVFPKATLLLCVFHLLQAMWKWLWDSSNEAPKEHRVHLLKSFRGLVQASTPTALMEGYTMLMEDHIASQHPKFLQHLEEVFQQREEWAICLQAQVLNTESQIKECVDGAMRVTKEKVLHRLKSYNLTQLVNFVVTKMESHYIHRLMDAANNRQQTSLKKVLKTKDNERHSIVQEDEDNYTVTSLADTGMSYHVDTAISCCTCAAGLKGGHCKHQSAVTRMFGHNDSYPLCSSPETRQLYHDILTGKDILDNGTRQFTTLVLNQPSQPEGTTQVCIAEILCIPDTVTVTESWCESAEPSLIQIPPSTSVETDLGEVHLKDRLQSVFQDITKKLDNPDFTASIASFVDTYENIKTDGDMVSALSSFGKSPQMMARGCKRRIGYLQTSVQSGVQLTALLSSNTCLDGEGTLLVAQPPKVSRKECICGSPERNPSPPFHSVSHCAEERMCLEGSH